MSNANDLHPHRALLCNQCQFKLSYMSDAMSHSRPFDPKVNRFIATIAVALCVGCGPTNTGNGNTGSGSGSSSTDDAGSTGGGGGVATSTGGGGGTGTVATDLSNPTGRLWHTNYAVDIITGTQIASLDGAAPERVSVQVDLTPWPDGRQFVRTEFDATDDTTLLQVFNRDSSTMLIDRWVTGYMRGADPSPVDKDIARFTLSETRFSTPRWVFMKLSDLTMLRTVTDPSRFSWLPDGSYIRVDGAGDIFKATLATNGETKIGHLDFQGVGENYSFGPVWASPDGKMLAVRLSLPNGGTNKADLWVAQLDGSGLAQLTDTGMTAFAVWSHDSRFIAFRSTPATSAAPSAARASATCSTTPAHRKVWIGLATPARRVWCEDRSSTLNAAWGVELIAWPR